jgi:endonuclease I
MSSGRGAGGAGDAARSGKQFVCCARRGCGKDGKKRCGGCKQVNTDLHHLTSCDNSR